MNKFEKKQSSLVDVYLANGMIDMAARSISALIRASMRAKAKAELMDFAKERNLINHPEFIV